VEVTDSDKHSSLLGHIINYDCKKFYDTRPPYFWGKMAKYLSGIFSVEKQLNYQKFSILSLLLVPRHSAERYTAE
jgi:hypothetical protein